MPSDDPGGAGPLARAEAGDPPSVVAGVDEPTNARLFAVGPDGLLIAREVELPGTSTTRSRAEALVRQLVEESGAFPEGAGVLDVFVSGRGVAVVNFTLDLLEGHPGGLLAEELTVYSLSHSLVVSFPAIVEVRLLVEGRAPETLAGHLDLRFGYRRAPDRLLADPDAGVL